MNTPSFLEDHISQIPALHVLQRLGYVYLRPQEAFMERQGKLSNVLLEGVLARQLSRINRFEFKGRMHPFSDASIQAAIAALKGIPYDGLIRTNERIYDLLSLGKSFEETVDNDTRSFQLQYIDWKRPENNIFHICEEFEVERRAGEKSRIPDIVAFVNGIPFVVIECKRPDSKNPIDQAISQQIRNQQDEEIPGLFVYSQLLIALSKDHTSYATTGTAAKFWSAWKEPTDISNEVAKVIAKPIPAQQQKNLFGERFRYVQDYFAELDSAGRMVTEQDKALHSLCRPDRLLQLAFRYIVFDAGVKKIARYQQYFAVEKSIERVRLLDSEGKRQGGVIWHTQGSGKSLTMVMLAKALALDTSITDPRVVLVTDRIDLDDQIWKTFHQCGKEPVRAKTGLHLLQLLRANKATVITTVIHKFEAAVKKQKYEEAGQNIFVLVDESHRSQYGTVHARMQQVLPNACYIGFTGTPLMTMEKNTAQRFGGMIDTYTIDQAVADKSVVPLLYEGRLVDQDVNEEAMDTAFAIVAEGLNKSQVRDLKQKFASTDQLAKAKGRLWLIAHDISEHFRRNWQGTPFKAQLAADSKNSAILYKEYLDEFGHVTSEVLISAPDTREGNESIYRAGQDKVQAFWKEMMARFGSEKEYNEQLISNFKHGIEPEIIIVVDKLLTGFDAPRNTVLYLDKSLEGHALLQAIARVNRTYEGKDYGYIIDYRGVIKKLGEAMDLYTTLPEFDPDDIASALLNVSCEVDRLPQKHSELWDIFQPIRNRLDAEEYEVFLAAEDRRQTFYEKLTAYNRTLSIALSSVRFHQETPQKRIKQYTDDLAFFLKLRVAVKRRYAEEIDFREYEARVKKLVDSYVTSHRIEPITELTNIFDQKGFQAELERLESKASQADTIAYRTQKTIDEKWEEDPFFYRKFSRILEDTIEAYRAERIGETEYLAKVTEAMESVRQHSDASIPEVLRHREAAKAFFGAAKDALDAVLEDKEESAKLATEVALAIDERVKQHAKVRWQVDMDAQNRMRNAIDEYLYALKDRTGAALRFEVMDAIVENSIGIAKAHYSR